MHVVWYSGHGSVNFDVLFCIAEKFFMAVMAFPATRVTCK